MIYCGMGAVRRLVFHWLCCVFVYVSVVEQWMKMKMMLAVLLQQQVVVVVVQMMATVHAVAW